MTQYVEAIWCHRVCNSAEPLAIEGEIVGATGNRRAFAEARKVGHHDPQFWPESCDSGRDARKPVMVAAESVHQEQRLPRVCAVDPSSSIDPEGGNAEGAGGESHGGDSIETP